MAQTDMQAQRQALQLYPLQWGLYIFMKCKKLKTNIQADDNLNFILETATYTQKKTCKVYSTNMHCLLTYFAKYKPAWSAFKKIMCQKKIPCHKRCDWSICRKPHG